MFDGCTSGKCPSLANSGPCGFQNTSFRVCNWWLSAILHPACTSSVTLNSSWNPQPVKHRLSLDCSPAQCRQDCSAAHTLIPAFIPRSQTLQWCRSISYCCLLFPRPKSFVPPLCQYTHVVEQSLLLTLLLTCCLLEGGIAYAQVTISVSR